MPRFNPAGWPELCYWGLVPVDLECQDDRGKTVRRKLTVWYIHAGMAQGWVGLRLDMNLEERIEYSIRRTVKNEIFEKKRVW